LNHSTRHSPDATGPNPIAIGFEAVQSGMSGKRVHIRKPDEAFL
jgi:hypothetical protein